MICILILLVTSLPDIPVAPPVDKYGTQKDKGLAWFSLIFS